jgi:hypothetical protein
MHMRLIHSDRWKGSLQESYPEGYEPGEQEPMRIKTAVTKRGKEKAPTVCPFCGHNSRRAQGLAAHLKGAHPDKWKGNMGSTLGLAPSRQWRQYTKGKRKLTRGQKWLATRKANLENGHLEDPRGYINCCPNCGEQLAAYYLAKGAMNRRVADNSLSVLQEGLRRAESRRS